jgi:Na+-transporting NADH:ubiquinone oxidoreductase subunit NqrF
MVFFIIFVEINNIMETEKETLEKAAANYGWRIKKNTFSDAVKANELAESAQQDFIAGAKWQAERMYSEEDMAEAFIACWKANVPDGIECKVSFNEWFEQFKKK